MKKILFTLFLIGSVAYGQVAVMGGGVPSGDYPAILDDGNTEAWYEAISDYITESSGVVSQWDDRSGNNNHLTQSTELRRPSWADDSVYFDGTNDLMEVSITGLEQPTSIYMVVKIRQYIDGDYVIDGYGTNNTGALTMIGVTDKIALTAGNLDANVLFTEDDFIVLYAVINGASSLIGADATTASGDAGSGDMAGIRLASRGAIGRESLITVKELIVRSDSDDSTDQSDIIDYLEDKYSL